MEWAIPGKALFYATAMPRRTGALPLVVTTDLSYYVLAVGFALDLTVSALAARNW